MRREKQNATQATLFVHSPLNRGFFCAALSHPTCDSLSRPGSAVSGARKETNLPLLLTNCPLARPQAAASVPSDHAITLVCPTPSKTRESERQRRRERENTARRSAASGACGRTDGRARALSHCVCVSARG